MRSKLFITVIALLGVLIGGPAAAADHGDKPGGDPRAADAAAASPEAVLGGLVQVQAGYNLSCGRTGAGQVRCWGDNNDGELGNGNTDPHDLAVPVRAVSGPGPLTGVTQIAVGDDHACALLTNKQVRCWGDNDYGELGNGDSPTDRSRPVPVRNASGTANLQNVRAISAESDGACALLTTDQVRCWGEDDYGQLGNGGGSADSDLPVVVRNVADTGPLTNVRSIEMGYDNNCALLNNGQGRCWGYNAEGELGNDAGDDSDVPVAVRAVSGPGNLTGITQIAIGGYQGCARLANGQARCWGQNDDGELGVGHLDDRDRPVVVKNASGTGPLQNVRAITGGYNHVCALITNGQARCWGIDDEGQTGDGGPLAGPDHKLPRPVVNVSGAGNLTGIVQLHANQNHTCALLNTGQARCWGTGDSGQLGDGTDQDRARPVKVQV
jgi:hypothetical protein